MDEAEDGGLIGAGQEDGEQRQLALGAGGGMGRALQVSLPAQLGQDPEELQRIRCAWL